MNAWFAERVHSIQPSANTSSSKESPPGPRALQATSEQPCLGSLPPSLGLFDRRSPSPAPSPAPGTPTRKISASEFDRPLRPIVVKDSEGSLTFVSDADQPERGPVPLRAQVMGEGGGGARGGDRCARLLELVRDVSRSEERRVGKEWLRLCRSRWSPYH